MAQEDNEIRGGKTEKREASAEKPHIQSKEELDKEIKGEIQDKSDRAERIILAAPIPHLGGEAGLGLVAAVVTAKEWVSEKAPNSKDVVRKVGLFLASLGIGAASIGGIQAGTQTESSSGGDYKLSPEPITAIAPEGTTFTETDEPIAVRVSDIMSQEAVTHEGVVMFEDIPVTESNKKAIAESKKWLEKNEHLRGEQRHEVLVEYLDQQMAKIQTMMEGGSSQSDIVEVAAETQATANEFNSLVKAGDITDILEAAVKVGLVSPDKAKAVARELTQKGTVTEITRADGYQIKTDDQVFRLTKGDMFTQIIGNAPMFEPSATPIGMHEGTEVEGVYDVEVVDPASADKIKSNEVLMRQLAENNWPEYRASLVQKARQAGGEIDEETAKEAFIKFVITQEKQTIPLVTNDERDVQLDTSDLELFGYQISTEFQLKELLGLDILPTITFHAEKLIGVDGRIIDIGGDVDVFGAKITKEMLCKGNFGIFLHLADVNIYIPPEVVSKSVITGDMNILLLFLAAALPIVALRLRAEPTPPEIVPPGFPPVKVPPIKVPTPRITWPKIPPTTIDIEGELGLRRVTKPGTPGIEDVPPIPPRNPKDFDEGRQDISGKPNNITHGQVTTTGGPYTPGGVEKNPSYGRLKESRPKGQRGKSGARNYRGNQSAQKQNTGK